MEGSEWFYHFNSGDFTVKYHRSGGREKYFEKTELDYFLSEYSCQSQKELARYVGVIQKAIS